MSLSQIINSEYWQLSLWNFAFFLLGIIYYFSLEYEPSTRYVIGIFGTSCTTLYLRKYGLLGVLFSGVIIAFSSGILISKIRVSQIHTVALESDITTHVEGVVSGLKNTNRGIQATLEQLKFGELLMQDDDPDKIRISIPIINAKNILIGDKISVLAKLTPPSMSILPGGYDFGLYSYFTGVGASGFALSKVTNLSSSNNQSQSIIHKIRRTIYFRLVETMGKDNGNFAAALLLGESGGLNQNILQNMRHAGLAHVLCVSGLHLSLVAGLFFLASRILLNLSNFIAWHTNIKTVAAIIAIMCSGMYLMLSGMQIAATRAYIMTSIFMIAVLLNRTPYPMRSLGIAAVIILTARPEYVLHPSFQLSFAAVLALIGGYEFYIKNKCILGNSSGVIAKLKLGIFSNIYSSLLAGIATTPIVMYHFYTISNYTVLSNLLVVPIVSFILMPLGILSIFLIPIGLDYYVLQTMGKFIEFIIDVAEFITNLPGAIWNFGYITPESLIVYLVGLFWLMLWNTKLRLYGILVIVISFCMMSTSPKPDVIFDAKMQILGIKNSSGDLEIHTPKISIFTENYWNNWFGQKKSMVFLENINHDHNIKTNSGQIVNILYDSKDTSDNLNIIAKDWINKGAILIFCDKDKCTLKFEDKKRFLFN